MVSVQQMLRGMELQFDGSTESALLDFAVWNDEKTLCLRLGWWRSGVIIGETVELVEGPLNKQTLRFDKSAISGMRLEEVEDEASLAFFDRERRLMDLDRADYLSALNALVESEPDFDFSPWVSAVMARPVIDPIKELAKARAIPRERGIVLLIDSDQKIVDALAVDARGLYHAHEEYGILASLYGYTWAEYPDETRPTPKQFLDWVYQQGVYGLYQVTEPKMAFDNEELLATVQRALDLPNH